MTLSSDCILYYALSESGVRGRATEGKVELHERDGLIVYDRFGMRNEYLSGERLRSWSVIRDGIPVPGWSHVMPEDAFRLTDHQEGIGEGT
ncbi:MAG TPA: hypothetical protein VK789_09460 [Bryobacteraceae bacterium]|jgi:hypothetical protein|nr:hypothetical protein [Bryobacteraceae bacterium]